MIVLQLELIADGRATPSPFQVNRMVNVGYAGRNRGAVKAHIEELSREGVPPPPFIPMIFPVLTHNITTAGEIEVIGPHTSGEAEFVLLLEGKNVFVGVGSDHTDRALERRDVVLSKQVCQNVMSREIWRLTDVEPRWDELLLQSWVKAGEEEILYQEAPLEDIIAPSELIEKVRSTVTNGGDQGLVIFSGTIPILADQIIYSDYFRCELSDPRSDRFLRCEYRVRRLDYL